MAYDFYVIDGKKLIDYKPTVEHYERAWNKSMKELESMQNYTSFKEIKENHPDILKKIIFLWIKKVGKRRRDIKEETSDFIFAVFNAMHVIDSIVGLLTPREFINIFPIEKDYTGHRYECKDYFSCMEYINKIGIDNPVGGSEQVNKFLWEYWNWDVNMYMCTWMEVVSAIHIMQGGKDPIIEFMEEKGVSPLYMSVDGNFLIDAKTGESFEISKPRNPMRKLFSVMK